MAAKGTEQQILELFWERLRRAPRRALMLDYDGTLAPFRVERSRAEPYPGVREELNALIAEDRSRVVVVSGRWTRDLAPLLGLDRPPEIWGSHGLERLRPDGRLEVAELGERQLHGLAEADHWVERSGLQDFVETKPGCLALHWRGLPEAEAGRLRRKVQDRWSLLAAESGLRLREFDGGLELRAEERDKGDAVRTVLAEMGEPCAAAYLGDDLTDEDAFRAIRGRGLGVLVRAERRPSLAEAWLRPPGELLDFLEKWRRACRRGSS